MKFAKLSLIVAAASLTACVSTQQSSSSRVVPTKDDSAHQLVTSLDLSKTVGEVGKPFASQMVHTDNFLQDAEYSVSTMPPGLRFDPATGTISGVPTAPGFYHLTLAVRERVAKDSLRPKPGHRWWTGDVELAIYNQINEDSEGL